MHHLVRPQDQGLLDLGAQPAPVHPVCRLHPLQRQPDLRDLQPSHRRLLHPVLPPQLPPAHFQGLLVLGYGRVRRRQSCRALYPVVCRLRRRRAVQAVSYMVG